MNRKGVAPIIATLLMVAIAVVGGILIFVFAQGFFSGTSDLNVGGNEALALTGYDFRDLEDLRTHNGLVLGGVNVVGNDPDGVLDNADGTDADAVIIYVRSYGTRDVEVLRVDVNGAEHTFDSANAGQFIIGTVDLASNVPDAGRFLLLRGTPVDGFPTFVDADAESDAIVEGGEPMSIVVRYDGDEDIPSGRNITVKVYTVNGEFSLPVTIGKRET